MRYRVLWAIFSAWVYAGCSDEHSIGGGDESDSDESTDSGEDTVDPRFEAFVTALKADLEKSEAFGVSAAVMEHGEITFAEAYGFKDADETEPLLPSTLMQIGSTTKQMTATTLLRRVEDGQLSLDDTLDAALPDFEFALDDTWDDQMTVHHLLSHQSGIVDWSPWNGGSDDDALSAFTFGEFKDTAYLMNPSGMFWNYSNPNFNLAGLLAENADTRAFPDILKEDVFGPLGLDRTFVRKSEVEADGDFALSYGFTGDEKEKTTMSPISMADVQDSAWMRPAGLVWSTPSQMMRWADFMLNGNEDVLSDEYREKMETGYADVYPDLPISAYGYGVFTDAGFVAENGLWYETPVLQHGGDTMSFTHRYYMLPDYDFAFSICASARLADFDHSILTALTTLVDLPDGKSPPIPEVDKDVFDRHVGEYFDPWLIGRVIISREEDDLLIEMPDVTAEGVPVEPELFAATSRVFVAMVDGEPFDVSFFSETQDGPSVYIRNRIMVATRVAEEAGALKKRLPCADGAAESFLQKRIPAPLWLRMLSESKLRYRSNLSLAGPDGGGSARK